VIPYAEINASVAHTLHLQIYNSLQGANRWHSPAKGGAALVVRGLALDSGAMVLPLPCDPPPPTHTHIITAYIITATQFPQQAGLLPHEPQR
jgi:hypothetical protein